jgi:UDP-glucose 4-epimerase
MQGVDYVFHAAAMKQVPICENNPIEAFKTNVLGSNNVLDSAIENNIKKVICLSTDKAVYPISTMGLTKSMMEKIALQKASSQNKTKINIVRFCNLIISNGNAVTLFMDQIKNGKKLTVTDLSMTRFFMTIEEAMDLV